MSNIIDEEHIQHFIDIWTFNHIGHMLSDKDEHTSKHLDFC